MINSLTDINSISTEEEFKEALRLMQKEKQIINRNGKVFILSDDERNGLMFTDVQSFKTYYRFLCLEVPVINTTRIEKKFVADTFFTSSSTTRLDGIIFDPRLQPGVNGKFFNIWKGWKYEPIKGEVSKFINLVEVNTNFNSEGTEYLLDFLAHSIQKPQHIPMTSIVVKGKQGTGKGTLFVDTILKLNENSKHITDMSMLTGDFNGHLADAYYVVADEIMFGGDHKEANKLKTFISEKKRMINDKMKTAYSVDSFTRSFILSNNDYIVNVEQGDRRYAIFNCADKLKGNFKWFDEYQLWLKNGGYNAIMYYLLNRYISKFNPLELPTTKEKQELQIKSSDMPTRFLTELLNGDIEFTDGVKVGNKIYRQRLYDMFVDYMKRYNPKGYIASSNEFGKIISKAFTFEQDNPNWRTNWKDKTGYFYLVPTEEEFMFRFSKNIFNAEAKDIFFRYEELVEREGSFIENVFTHNYDKETV